MCHKQRYLLPYRPRLRATLLYNKQMFVKGDRRRGIMYSIYRCSNGLTYSIACGSWLACYTTLWGASLDPSKVVARGRKWFWINFRRGHDRQGITNSMTIYKQRGRRSIRQVQANVPGRRGSLRIVRRQILYGIEMSESGRWQVEEVACGSSSCRRLGVVSMHYLSSSGQWWGGYFLSSLISY